MGVQGIDNATRDNIDNKNRVVVVQSFKNMIGEKGNREAEMFCTNDAKLCAAGKGEKQKLPAASIVNCIVYIMWLPHNV